MLHIKIGMVVTYRENTGGLFVMEHLERTLAILQLFFPGLVMITLQNVYPRTVHSEMHTFCVVSFIFLLCYRNTLR